MSEPLTEAELDVITAKIKEEGCDSADEGMASVVTIRAMDPDEVRKMYDLT